MRGSSVEVVGLGPGLSLERRPLYRLKLTRRSEPRSVTVVSGSSVVVRPSANRLAASCSLAAVGLVRRRLTVCVVVVVMSVVLLLLPANGTGGLLGSSYDRGVERAAGAGSGAVRNRTRPRLPRAAGALAAGCSPAGPSCGGCCSALSALPTRRCRLAERSNLWALEKLTLTVRSVVGSGTAAAAVVVAASGTRVGRVRRAPATNGRGAARTGAAPPTRRLGLVTGSSGVSVVAVVVVVAGFLVLVNLKTELEVASLVGELVATVVDGTDGVVVVAVVAVARLLLLLAVVVTLGAAVSSSSGPSYGGPNRLSGLANVSLPPTKPASSTLLPVTLSPVLGTAVVTSSVVSAGQPDALLPSILLPVSSARCSVGPIGTVVRLLVYGTLVVRLRSIVL
uniref:Uncharacterized protein n=1 Tax=Anopheles merus TaxID=30066 RepID=A0A182V9M9_ANOME